MGGGGRARETHLDKDSEGTGCEEEHPETANSLSGTHSAAEAKPAFHPEARECRLPDAPTPGLSSGPAEVAAPGKAFPAAVAAGAKQPDKSHPPAPPVQSILLGR